MALRRNAKRNFFSAKLVTENRVPCAFCQRDVDDELIYGKLYAIGDIQCHYFCVLLSSCLIQKGRDDAGLFGFMYNDILAEIERSKKHKCSYCGRDGATLGCAVSQCRKQFHLPCGRERNAVSLFYGNYKSFCQNHARKQKIPDNIMEKVKIRKREANKKKCEGGLEVCTSPQEPHKLEPECVCVICYEEVDAFPTLQTFWPPCCARDAWFHRTCLQRMALSAGMHYLKCPLCNDKENFYDAVINQGYYVPDRDAAWELEQNAFSEIYERVLRCTAEACLCPGGRTHDTEGMWDIVSCLLCGGAGWHRACAGEHAVELSTEASDSTTVAICTACRPAAPADLKTLTTAIQAVIQTEQRQSVRPVMPSRMSLRRTKRPAGGASTSRHNDAAQNMPITQEANLKSPIKNQSMLLKFASPTKLIEQGFRERIDNLGVEVKLENVLDEVKQRLRRPKPLSEKLKAINNILDSMMDSALKEPKQKEEPKLWCSPKKCADIIEHDEHQEIKQETEAPQPAESDDSSSTFQLPSEFIADIHSDDSLPIFNTPTKLKTVDIQKDSSLEISANDKSVDINVVKMEDSDNVDFLHSLSIKSPVKSKKCALKFSPTDKEMLQESNIGIDLESFKNHYLNEVVRECNTEIPHVTKVRKRKHPKDKRRSKKRKLDDIKINHDERKRERRIKKKKLKTKVSITNDNIQVKIKWRTERLNLEIRDKKKVRNKQKKESKKMKKLKQYVLQYTQDSVKDVLVKPEKEVSPLKRKYVKQEKSPDKLVQTSIQRFFTVKSP
ncbi:uncharacterized protein LOC115451975 [Manduca sexta]|uniref:uncharacterized protein LOC115451975 n=1 Tax=Manduca sexta TaxID=7130 RepID=UPI00188F0930|nr:uncharacterized protein LOC115451975 [Manduca sexta]